MSKLGALRDIRRFRFWGMFATHMFSCVGLIAVLFGLYDVLEPNAISKIHFPFLLAVLLLAALYAAIRSYPRPVSQAYSKPNTEIRIVEGDLFSQEDNLVIGMTTTFDSQIPHVIHPHSIQGQFLHRVYSNDVAALDIDLEQGLAQHRPIGQIEKPGKKTRYATGTVVTIQHQRKHYFCVAYGEMDEANQAHATMDGIWRSLENLWREVGARANGDPVAIPVVGGGLARLSQILPAQDSIRFIAMSFIFASRHARICDRLDIVVRPEDVERLDMLELQAFLKSLQDV
ncbi:macro domain-containing protein [Micromonospora sp. NPDC005194]|uniref:macro domain-containing protein n=1 Tax=Micromonospora sp. NPDC005194 TaxID=3156870 RepID=UPI0033B5B166